MEMKDKMVEYQRKYYQEHKDERRKYYQEHKDEITEYIRERKIEIPYGKLGDFLKRKLKELNKNQSWLAKQIGVSKESAKMYSAGVSCPKDKVKRRLCKVLRIKYSDLEKLVENKNVKS